MLVEGTYLSQAEWGMLIVGKLDDAVNEISAEHTWRLELEGLSNTRCCSAERKSRAGGSSQRWVRLDTDLLQGAERCILMAETHMRLTGTSCRRACSQVVHRLRPPEIVPCSDSAWNRRLSPVLESLARV